MYMAFDLLVYCACLGLMVKGFVEYLLDYYC